MDNTAYIVLAAGQGKRMNSALPKVLHHVSGKPLLYHVVQSILSLSPQQLGLVVGHQHEKVEKYVRDEIIASANPSATFTFALQSEQKGTGHAVKIALAELKDFVGTFVIAYGDMPLLRPETLSTLVSEHRSTKATVSVLTCSSSAHLPYGRIVRNSSSQLVERIVEAKDCSPQERALREYNVGVYAVDSAFLYPAVDALTDNNAQKEFYLTDIISKASKEGQKVHSVSLLDEDELQGVNDLYDLQVVEEVFNKRRIKGFILSGVTFLDRSSVWIDSQVRVATGVTIGPNVQLRGATSLASGVHIEGSCVLIDTDVKENAFLKCGVRAERSVIGSSATVGPFAHLREGSHLGSEVKIGNFVETKKAIFADGAKASHLSYLGDCTVGDNANIGAGTITCNYDGQKKHTTTIGKDCFIGSDTVLIAPVTIGDGAYIGAGSAISKNIEADALAFSRPPLLVKPGWAKRRAQK